MAKVARRRAEHFATFDAQAAEDEPGGLGTVHSGGNDIRKLGPWSSAVELVEARKAAQELRMERLRQRDSKGGADVGWTPKRDVSLGPRKAPAHVTASAPVSAETTARRFEGAESLEGATDDDRVALADALCRLGRMTREAALLLADGAPGVFAIGNCAALDADSLSAALALCLTPRLDTLSLRFCGRGMTDAAGDVFLRAAGIPVAPRDASGDRTAPESKDEGEAGASATASKLRVREVALAGAYKLSPGGFANVLRATPELRSLSVPQCPRLDDGALAQLASVPHLESLDLSGCGAVTADGLASALESLPELRRLTLDSLPCIDDGSLAVLAPRLSGLMALSIARVGTPESRVTDAGLATLVPHVSALKHLDLSYNWSITDASLALLGASCKNLESLNLKRCTRLTDDGVATLLACGLPLAVLSLHSVALVGGLTCAAIERFLAQTIRDLDLSWCRGVSEDMCGRITDECRALRTLWLWGCTHITRRFLDGHSNDELDVKL